ncbi:MAG: HAMP domain-containing sensor histidine kinase [Thermodesulfobacteriota bacterium]
MKLRSMYTRILLSFLVVLLITEVFVFSFFILIPAKHFTARFEQFARARVLVVKERIEDKIRSLPAVDWSENAPLEDFITDLGLLLGAPVWLTRQDGTVALKSFAGEIPDLAEILGKDRAKRQGGFARAFKDFDFYTVVPLDLSGTEAGHIHILFKRPAASTPKGFFALGLLIIGVIVALSVVPVSRLIIRRIEQLRRSAILISAGDLSHRVTIRGKDEIGDLAHAFNDMTDKIESMIVSSKELTANVSHELRAPLTRIRVAEELLRDKLERGSAQDWKGYLDGIREDIDELDGLIGRILDLSKLDRRQSPFRLEPLDPSELIRELLERFHPVIERKDLQVTTELSYDPPFLADKETLRSALMNVLDNATKFAPEKGDVSVHLGWKPEAVEMLIMNTAEELSPEDLARIFDPFHRSKRSAAAGSGLGLTIAKKAVERHGGAIEALNREKGLGIRITLPR